MFDLKECRENPGAFRIALQRRSVPHFFELFFQADQAWRSAAGQTQELQTQRNGLAKQIEEEKRAGRPQILALKEEATQVRLALEQAQRVQAQAKTCRDEIVAQIPNFLADDVPPGEDENSNQVLKTWGECPDFGFIPQSHDVLGRQLNQMDFEAAVRMAGSRFVVLKGPLARLERALAQFMLDLHTNVFGYLEVAPPYLVKREAVFGVGQLPKFADDLFQTTDDRWLISTAEVSLTNLVADQILEQDALPLRYVAYTPCFRAEAGTAGKDTRGMVRLHQFSKVELVHITTPQAAQSEYEYLHQAAQTVLQRLNLPYRVVALCAGDMGFAARRTWDLEVWLPAQKTYREISSCSDYGAFQARRMRARFRRSRADLDYVHTLNGSGLPTGRTLVAILENYQQRDGSILVPKVLVDYMGGVERIEKI